MSKTSKTLDELARSELYVIVPTYAGEGRAHGFAWIRDFQARASAAHDRALEGGAAELFPIHLAREDGSTFTVYAPLNDAVKLGVAVGEAMLKRYEQLNSLLASMGASPIGHTTRLVTDAKGNPVGTTSTPHYFHTDA